MQLQIREFQIPEELDAAFAIIRELRPHLTFDAFRNLLEAARAHEGYRLLGAFADGSVADAPRECVAAIGYRVLHDFVHGRHLYIDDLVVAATRRCSGIGSRLLAHAERLAREQGCVGLRLCTGVENEGGIRFYGREGWALRAHAFKKPVVS